RLEMPGLRRAQVRVRDGGDLTCGRARDARSGRALRDGLPQANPEEYLRSGVFGHAPPAAPSRQQSQPAIRVAAHQRIEYLLRPMGIGAGHAVAPGPSLRDVEGSEHPVEEGKGHGIVAEIAAVPPIAVMAVMHPRRDQNMFQRAESRPEQMMSANRIVPPEMAVSDEIPAVDGQQ